MTTPRRPFTIAAREIVRRPTSSLRASATSGTSVRSPWATRDASRSAARSGARTRRSSSAAKSASRMSAMTVKMPNLITSSWTLPAPRSKAAWAGCRAITVQAGRWIPVTAARSSPFAPCTRSTRRSVPPPSRMLSGNSPPVGASVALVRIRCPVWSTTWTSVTVPTRRSRRSGRPRASSGRSARNTPSGARAPWERTTLATSMWSWPPSPSTAVPSAEPRVRASRHQAAPRGEAESPLLVVARIRPVRSYSVRWRNWERLRKRAS